MQLTISAYLNALTPLQAHFQGIYIYGSIALNAYEEGKSDIDIVAITQTNLGIFPLEI